MRQVTVRRASYPRTTVRGMVAGINARSLASRIGSAATSYLKRRKSLAQLSKKKAKKYGKKRTEKFERLDSIAPHNSMVKERVYINLAKKKHMKINTLGQSVIFRSLTYIFGAPEGQQGTDILPRHGSKQILEGTVVGPNNFNALPYQPAGVDPNLFITGNANVTTTNVGYNYWYFLDSVHGYTNLTNFSNLSAQIDIFYLLCLKDADDDPIQAWTKILQSDARLGVAALTQPTVAGGTLTSGGVLRSTVGESPFKHSTFRRLWKPVKHVSIILEGGQNHVLEFEYVYKKPMNIRVLDERPSANLAGLTLVPIMIHHGGMVKIKDGQVGAVTFGVTNIGMIHSEYTKIKQMPKTYSSLELGADTVVSGNPAAHTAYGAQPNNELMVDDTDQIRTVQGL